MDLIEFRECSLDICKDTEMKAQIRGVQGMMATFPFYFGCTLGAFILKHTDNLSLALQGSSMSAAQGQQVAEEVCKTVSRDRSEAAFDLFWTWLLKRKSEVDAVAEPQLPRKRRLPRGKKHETVVHITFLLHQRSIPTTCITRQLM